MTTKRLFIGSYIDNSLFDVIYKEFQEDFTKVCNGKWAEQNILHFTYKFLGNVNIEEIPQITERLQDVCKDYDSVLNIKGLGIFPHPANPKLLFAKVFNQDKRVLNTFFKIEKEMTALGFDKEPKKFHPHITLLRIKTANTEKFESVLREYSDTNIGMMQGFRVNLIESTLTNTGPIYKTII